MQAGVGLLASDVMPIYMIIPRYFVFFTLHLYHKNTKNIILSYLSDLTLVSDRVGIDNSLSCWLRGFICLCRCEGLVCSLLLDWYLGCQKLREILTLLCCITLSSSRENQRKCSRGSKKDFWRRCRGGLRKSQHTKYPSHTFISRITLFAICLSFSSPPLHPCRFIRPLSLSSLSFSIFLFLPACFFVCLCVSSFACRYG